MRIFVGIGDKESIALFTAGYFELFCQGREEATLDIGNDDAQRVGLLRNQAAGDLIGDVVKTLGKIEHQSTFFLAYPHGFSVEDKRNRSNRKARFTCDIFEANALLHGMLPLLKTTI